MVSSLQTLVCPWKQRECGSHKDTTLWHTGYWAYTNFVEFQAMTNTVNTNLN